VIEYCEGGPAHNPVKTTASRHTVWGADDIHGLTLLDARALPSALLSDETTERPLIS
jgi:hypothetical protein